MKELLEAIDTGISNAYKVIDGDHDMLCVVERQTGKHYEISVKEIED